MVKNIQAEKTLGVEIKIDKEIVTKMEEKEIILKIEAAIILGYHASLSKGLEFNKEWIKMITEDIAGDNCTSNETGMIEENCNETELTDQVIKQQRELMNRLNDQEMMQLRNTERLKEIIQKYDSIRISDEGQNPGKTFFNETLGKLGEKENCINEIEVDEDSIEIGKEERENLNEMLKRMYTIIGAQRSTKEEDLGEVEDIAEIIEEGVKNMKGILNGIEQIQESEQGKIMNPGRWRELKTILEKETMGEMTRNETKYPWKTDKEMEKTVRIEKDTSYCDRIGKIIIPYYDLRSIGKIVDVTAELFMVLGVDRALHIKQKNGKMLEYKEQLYQTDGNKDLKQVGNTELLDSTLADMIKIEDKCYWRIKEKKILEALKECKMEAYFIEELVFETQKTSKPYYYSKGGTNITMKCGNDVRVKTFKEQGRLNIGKSCGLNVDSNMEYTIECRGRNPCSNIKEIKENVYNITEIVSKIIDESEIEQNNMISELEQSIEKYRLNVNNETFELIHYE